MAGGRSARTIAALVIPAVVIATLGLIWSTPVAAVTSSGATSVNFSAISAGDRHTCGLTTVGGVKCWGGNDSGQLGDGTTTARLLPVDVSGLTSGVVAIATGAFHSCALTAAGGVRCWGSNENGQVGDGTTTNRLVPVDVSGLTSGVAAISAGGGQTCALTATGGMKCWGWNENGQVGDGTTTNRLVPVDVSGLTSGVAAISAGGAETCALTVTGGVKCWGWNWRGGLGDGTTVDSAVPVDVSGLSSGVVAISAGSYHACALTDQGGVKCWGIGATGSLGNGNELDSPVPVDVVGLSTGVAQVSARYGHTCALTVEGGVKCWGWGGYGELGNGSTTSSSIPVDVVGLTTGVVALSVAHMQHSCAITADGIAMCWGANQWGQLGNGTTRSSSVPVQVVVVPRDRLTLSIYWGPKGAETLAYRNTGTLSPGDYNVDPPTGWRPSSITGSGTVPSRSGIGHATVTFDIVFDSATLRWSGTLVVSDPGAGFSATIPIHAGRLEVTRSGTKTHGTLWGIKALSVPKRCFKITFLIDDLA
jgi:alpha-tubulin suppressor-like RCC1 family protein